MTTRASGLWTAAFVSLLTCALQEKAEGPLCPEFQQAFGGSCFEFVNLHRSFPDAQSWCERGGGHLAFIPNRETQQFLQKHLMLDEDWWLGVAPKSRNLTQELPVTAAEGPLFWLDGSEITYSNWAQGPVPNASCGHVLQHAAFQWESSHNCSQEFYFICQFESGRALACMEHNATLQCGSGQVIEVDDSFYGRKTQHYCRASSPRPHAAPAQEECSWTEVADVVAGQCHGLQVCQVAAADVASLGEPCQPLGSYLSVEYHCKDGLHLLLSNISAVFENITITVRWLLQPYRGNLTCTINTGDGRTIDPYCPETSGESVTHRYSRPGVYTVAVECTTSEWHVAAQKAVTVQEPADQFGLIRCYSGKQAWDAGTCRTLYNHTLEIQVELEAGTDVTYQVLHGNVVLATAASPRGIVPHNITLVPAAQEQLGPGCHHLTLHAFNEVTPLAVSVPLSVCLLEPVAGLQASAQFCQDAQLQVTVSLAHGAPAQLHIQVSGSGDNVSETREVLQGDRQVLNITASIQGPLNVRITATNGLSDEHVDVGNVTGVCNESEPDKDPLEIMPVDELQRAVRASSVDINVQPQTIYIGTNSVTLSASVSNAKSYSWSCDGNCRCNPDSTGQTLTIGQNCLPDVYSFYRYAVDIKKPGNNGGSTCVTVIPNNNLNINIVCAAGCDNPDPNQGLQLQLNCDTCENTTWYYTEPTNIQGPVRSCYNNYMYTLLQNGGVNVLVKDQLKTAKSVVVVGVSGGNSGSATYDIKSTSRTTPPPHTKTTHSPNTHTTSHKTSATPHKPEVTTPAPQHHTSSISGGKTKNTPHAKTTHSPVLHTTSSTSHKPTGDLPKVTTAAPGHHSTRPPPTLDCRISPATGTTLTPFAVICTTSDPVCDAALCHISVITQSGNSLYNGVQLQATSLFLPLGDKSSNYKLSVNANLVTPDGQTVSTTMSAQVTETSPNLSVQNLQNLTSNTALTVPAMAQLYQSVATQLNSAASSNVEKNELRAAMLDHMSVILRDTPCSSADEVQQVAGAVVQVTQQANELSPSAQVQASGLLMNLSQSIISQNATKEQVHQATATIVSGVGGLLKSFNSFEQQSVISSHLLGAVDSVQSALLAGQGIDEEPVVLSTPQISVYAHRMTAGNLQGQSFNMPNSTASFTLPSLDAGVLPTASSVGVRMLSLGVNPFSWSGGQSIMGAVGGLSLSAEDGSVIPVVNLTKEIQIFLPRAEAAQTNSSLLDLSQFSTVMINVTTPNVTLVLKLDPSEDLALQLLLGFQEYPNDTNHQAKTQLPLEGVTQEEQYTWVVDPGDVGVYYLLVRPIVGSGVNSTNATVSVTSIASQCVYWDEANTNWSTAGCRVGPLTSPLATQCLCTHLTFFGSSFFVMPNAVDVSRTAELFSTFSSNPVVVCFVGAILVAYFIVLIWARRKDLRDQAKVKVTVLDDNDPLAQYRYLLSISTGHRRGASTSSQVTVTLQGSEGESDPHHLTDTDKPVFERGGVDMFLLTTPFSVGALHSVRLWHDNSGKHPSWYINKVMVQDMETGQKWQFLCNSWLSIDMGDCVLDKTFPVASEMDLKKFSNLFFMKTAKDFGDEHLWYSVVNRPPTSHFTCVQRVSCCLSLLLCTMLTNIMFYGIPKDPAEQKMDLGHIEFTWQQIMIGFESSIIMFPVNLFIVSIFRKVRPREQKHPLGIHRSKTEGKHSKSGRVSPNGSPTGSLHREITPEAVVKDIKRIAQTLSKTMKNPGPQLELDEGRVADINGLLSMVEEIIRQQNRAGGDFYSDSCKKDNSLVLTLGAVNLQESTPSGSPERSHKQKSHSQYLYRQLQHVEKELEMLGPARFHSPASYSQAVQQVQGMKALLESRLSWPREQLVESPARQEKARVCGCCHGGLPWWFVYVAWALVAVTSGVSAYFTMLYGLTYGKTRSISWLISMVVSFFHDLLIKEPLKVLGFAVFFALVLKKVEEEEIAVVPIDEGLTSSDSDAVLSARRDSSCSFYRPPPPSNIQMMRNNMIKEQKAFALIREILVYLGFMWMLLLVAYGQRDPNAYQLSHHIKQQFRHGVSEAMSIADVFNWTDKVLLRNLFGQYPGFITDGNSKLVGNARVRQVRVRTDSCTIPRSMQPYIHDCQAPYTWAVEDTSSYGPGWNRNVKTNGTLGGSPWTYQNQQELRTQPIWGNTVLYRGGGFVAQLGPDMDNASSVLQYLFENTWLDTYTRGVFFEFTVYNANINLFGMVTLLLESVSVGAFQHRIEIETVRLYQAPGGLYIFVMAAEVIFFLFILYYMFVQGKLMKAHGWAYFSSKWNLLELSIILLSWSALGVFITRMLVGVEDMNYYQSHRDQFASFHKTATADIVLGYLIAFLLLLATVKLWHLLRLNPKLHMITSTLKRAWTDISGFIIVIVIMFLAYSIACNLIFGWKLYSYRTLMDAATTVVSLQLGIFNYDEVLQLNSVLSAFIVGSCIIFMTFVVLNLFISVIMVAFSQEQLYHKPSEEEEIADLMLVKLCSLFGITLKKNHKDNPSASNVHSH